MRVPFLIAILGITLPCLSRAELIWKTPILEIESPAQGAQKQIPFYFQNLGPETIRIDAVDSSCNCLRTDLSKRIIGPGESGTLTATVRTIGEPTNRTVRLEITTSDAPTRKHTLKLRLLATSLASLEPALLWWPQNGASRPLKSTLVIPEGAIPTIPPPPPESPFEWRLEQEENASRFLITVTPRSCSKPQESSLLIHWSQPGSDRLEKRVLFLRIQSDGPTTSPSPSSGRERP